jgi:hypothetical protein
MGVELWANPYGINLRCYWEPFGEQLEYLGSSLGTSRESMVHTLGTRKKQKNPPWGFVAAFF